MATPHPAQPERLILRRPDDWHVHLRDGALLAGVVNHTAFQFGRAIVMPNLKPPVTTVAAAAAYRDRIYAALEPGLDFTPLMTAYLTDDSDPDELERGFRAGVFTAAKLYPANATTNSAAGVTDIRRLDAVLGRLSDLGMPLLVHGEVTDRHVDVFDREAAFIERVLRPTLVRFPALRVVFEHITTREAVDFVGSAATSVAATITAHHLEINRSAMFDGGMRPHLYCLPVAKRETHRLALRQAAVSGSTRFFLGTDSAPHAVADKESACGCAGIFSAPVALESYAKVFEEENALHRLEGFASLHGPAFYGLPANSQRVALVRGTQRVPARIDTGAFPVVPFHAGQELGWQFAGAVAD
jgi:dihydroorotase